MNINKRCFNDEIGNEIVPEQFSQSIEELLLNKLIYAIRLIKKEDVDIKF